MPSGPGPSLPLADLVAASFDVAATSARSGKVARLAGVLSATGSDEAGLVAGYLSGSVRQRRTGVGYRSLSSMPGPAEDSTLTVTDVDAALERMATASGSGSAGVRAGDLAALLGRATAAEQTWLRALLTGSLRQGALDGVVLGAVATAYAVPEASVRRALMMTGSLAAVATLAATGGRAALDAETLVVGRPLHPMLAASAPTPAEALESTGGGTWVVDGKLDGIRIQAHRRDGEVRVWTRSLDEITDRLPEVVADLAALPGGDLVVDGEAIVLHDGGRPAPFQVTGARTASQGDPQALRASAPLTTYLFDVLHRDGVTLLDEPLTTRHEHLADLAPHLLVPRLLTADPVAVDTFFAELVAAGHEGIVVKAADAPYAAGRRGKGWVKVKPVHTLDLVVLAVERGSGRRRGWLSNIHLGARDPETGGFVMVGKTFKGMTDEMLRWQTERFTELAVGPTDGWVVEVRPEQVVEIALDGIQRSSRYPGGVALRFARVVRYRDDKRAEDADTIDAVRSLGG